MNPEQVPSPGVLTAHVRTAVDGAVRWLDRALAAGPGDVDTWDHSNFYARMILMRGLERGELLMWSLEREGQQATSVERVAVTRAGGAYWGEARDGLDSGLKLLRRLADASPTYARADVMAVRERLTDAAEWLTSLAEALARTDQRTIELDGPRPQDRDLAVELDAP